MISLIEHPLYKEKEMGLPPLDDRSIAVLQEELGRLEDTYENCAKIFGPNISPSGARALDRINDAREAIQKEISTRS
jgi:hypothetical protein